MLTTIGAARPALSQLLLNPREMPTSATTAAIPRKYPESSARFALDDGSVRASPPVKGHIMPCRSDCFRTMTVFHLMVRDARRACCSCVTRTRSACSQKTDNQFKNQLPFSLSRLPVGSSARERRTYQAAGNRNPLPFSSR